MSRVLVLNKSVAGDANSRSRRRAGASNGGFSWRKRSNEAGSAQLNLVSLAFVLAIFIAFGGAFYLYQVNDIATKGYEIRDLQNKIDDLNKEGKKLEIQSVQLRSMDNIEKASQGLNLINSTDVSYVQIDGPMAMK